MRARNFKVEPKGILGDPLRRPVGPFHQRERFRVPGKLLKADGIEIALPLEAVKVKVPDRKFPFVKVKQDKGRAFDPLPVFDPEPPGQPFDEKGLAAPDGPRQGHAIPGPEPSGEFFRPRQGLLFGAGMKNGI